MSAAPGTFSALGRALVQQGKLMQSDATAIQLEASKAGLTFVQQLVASRKLSARDVSQFAANAFGYPLLEPEASTYCYSGKLTYRGDSVEWFGKRKDFRAAPKPQEAHRGTGEVFTYIDPKTDAKGMVLAGVVNRKRGFGVKIEFPKKQYPRMGNWQHWGPCGSYTGALEPMTAGVEGRPVDRQRGWLRTLEPGETIELTCTITATNEKAELQKLLNMNK